MHKILGFIVVRKAEHNFDMDGRGAFYRNPPRIDNLFYCGIDRMPWFELDEAYYAGTLPSNIAELRVELYESNRYIYDIKVMRDINKASRLLDFSNKDNVINELVAIHSSLVETNNYHFNTYLNIEWTGIDIYCHGYGSLIREGLFSKPHIFEPFIELMNRYGLFNMNDIHIDDYIESYVSVAQANNLEPINGAREYLDKIKVGRVSG